MNLSRLFSLSLVALAAGPLAGAQTVNAKFIKRTQDRIAALYQRHDQRAPAPGERGNPFRIGGEIPVTPQPGSDAETISDASRDVLLLRQAAATVKVTGVVNVANRMHIAVDKSTYREGGVIPVQLPGEMVFLRVGEITPRSAVLRLREAELTLKF
jgi:hypothetical protein